MIGLIVISALIYVSSAAGKIEASWALCTGKDATECDTGKYANVSNEVFVPNPPPVGENFTITGMGYSLEAITDPSYSMKVVDGVLVDQTITGVNIYLYIHIIKFIY